MEKPTYEEFVRCLRSALHYLYDPDQLRRSPLVALLGAASRSDPASALRGILTASVEALKPAPSEPPQSRAWRIYDALFFRYVRGLDRDAVAGQLGISGRQLRREQRVALETLAQHLWQQFNLDQRANSPEIGDPKRPTTGEEPAWLKDMPPERSGSFKPALQAVLDLITPLARQSNVALHSEPAEALAELVVPQVTLRHALLNLLTVIVPRAQNGLVRLQANPVQHGIEIEIICEPPVSLATLSDSDSGSLEMARQLVGLAGGRLSLTDNRASLARLMLFTLGRVNVLVVDDNADSVQLLQRYASGTRYNVTGISEPEHALHLAEKLGPHIIILDVMMPDVDGWELLSQLRQHPPTSHIPIIIHTILPQETLARALGASAFMRKPVTRDQFVQALDQLAPILTPA